MSVKKNLLAFMHYENTKVNGHSFKTSGDSPLLDAIGDDNLKEQLRAYQHFLVDSQFEK